MPSGYVLGVGVGCLGILLAKTGTGQSTCFNDVDNDIRFLSVGRGPGCALYCAKFFLTESNRCAAVVAFLYAGLESVKPVEPDQFTVPG